jgi:hypothetical protein
MRQETYKCDVCNMPKGEGNRWLMGWALPGGFALTDWGFAPQNAERVYHFCSEVHALTEQGRHLRQDRSTLEDRKPVAAEVRVMPSATRVRKA